MLLEFGWVSDVLLLMPTSLAPALLVFSCAVLVLSSPARRWSSERSCIGCEGVRSCRGAAGWVNSDILVYRGPIKQI